ncbi:hypothetical protein ANAPC5_01367 [Anaplasma phagocytophilum]|nr:hypothetical protein ANAPC5_01367 [Anaplasma phagocytophilum]
MLLIPNIVENVQQKMTAQRQKQKHYADQHSKRAPGMRAGDKVRMWEDNRHWTPGVIVKSASTPRSYWVRTRSGQYRRNTSFIRPTQGEWETPRTCVSSPTQDPKASSGTTLQEQSQPAHTTTRSGRTVKPVMRMNL